MANLSTAMCSENMKRAVIPPTAIAAQIARGRTRRKVSRKTKPIRKAKTGRMLIAYRIGTSLAQDHGGAGRPAPTVENQLTPIRGESNAAQEFTGGEDLDGVPAGQLLNEQPVLLGIGPVGNEPAVPG